MTEAEIINAFKENIHIEVLYLDVWYEAVLKELHFSRPAGLDRINVFLLRGGYSYARGEIATIRKSEFHDHLRQLKK
jgi:hypothetical protein